MKRFFVVALSALLAAGLSDISWSQSGGASGGGGATGGAGGAGAAGAAGAGGTAGSNIGTQRAPSPGSGVGTAPNPQIASGAANQNAAAGFNANQNYSGFNQNPFFADPGVQQQLRMNNTQYNRLNRAYQRAFQRYNRNLSDLNTAGGQTSAAARYDNRATSNAERRRQLRSRNYDSGTSTLGTSANGNVAAGVGARDGATGASTNAAAAANARNSATLAGPNPSANATGGVRSERLAEFRNEFNTEFNRAVDSTFTDPELRNRFNQLNWQSQGFSAFNDPMVQQRLNLTAQQRQQLATLNSQWQQQLMDLQAENRGNMTQEQFNAFRGQFFGQLDSVLTPTQLQQWTQLIGDQYDFPHTTYYPSITNERGIPQGVQSAPQTRSVDSNLRGRSDGDSGAQIVPYNAGRQGSDRQGRAGTTQ